jgi:hypothetical protein
LDLTVEQPPINGKAGKPVGTPVRLLKRFDPKGSNPMNFHRILFIATLAVSSMALPAIVNAQAPDNTTVNKRDRDPGQATADQQKENRSDRDLTKQIRQSIVADKSLSTFAHNVKIISQNGTVTLKGR